MRKKECLWLVGYVCAALIFGYGVMRWRQAACYAPADPETAPCKNYRVTSVDFNQPLTRYSRLLRGELFFGPTPSTMADPGVSQRRDFQSNIRVYGLIRGKNSRAVVGWTGETQTWIVRPGSVIRGERIVAIAAKYLVIQNNSGEGKVFYQN